MLRLLAGCSNGLLEIDQGCQTGVPGPPWGHNRVHRGPKKKQKLREIFLLNVFLGIAKLTCTQDINKIC